MGVGRAQNGRMQRSGSNAEIVDEASASGQECRILDPLDRLAEPACCSRHALTLLDTLFGHAFFAGGPI
jgi:hypothetical protein